jgi:type I restriction enzyme M protein
MLRTRKVKFTAAQVKLIRTWLGTKDPEAKEVYKKPLETQGTDYEWDSDLSDTETIPWQQDVEEYLEQNVRPYAPDFQVDESKTKIGYEIPFVREFYKYVQPDSSSVILERIKKLQEKETEVTKRLLS